MFTIDDEKLKLSGPKRRVKRKKKNGKSTGSTSANGCNKKGMAANATTSNARRKTPRGQHPAGSARKRQRGVVSNPVAHRITKIDRGLRGNTYGAASPCRVYSRAEVANWAASNNMPIAPTGQGAATQTSPSPKASPSSTQQASTSPSPKAASSPGTKTP